MWISPRKFVLTLALLWAALPATTVRAADPQRPAAADSLSVATINMWHKDRPRELAALAQNMRADMPRLPDFILCQEVVFERGEDIDNTAAVLARNLGYFCRGTKRTSDREGVAIISRYPFLYYGERHLKSQTSGLLLGFRRVSIMGEFRVPDIGLVRVVNVHLTNWGFEHHVRNKQIRETLAWIVERNEQVPADVTILGGDFNARRDWDEMDQVNRPLPGGQVKFMDFNSTKPTMGSPGNPKKRIDFIFVAASNCSVGLQAEKLLWTDGLTDGSRRFYLSDHQFLLHEYSFSQVAQAAAPNARPTAHAQLE